MNNEQHIIPDGVINFIIRITACEQLICTGDKVETKSLILEKNINMNFKPYIGMKFMFNSNMPVVTINDVIFDYDRNVFILKCFSDIFQTGMFDTRVSRYYCLDDEAWNSYVKNVFEKPDSSYRKYKSGDSDQHHYSYGSFGYHQYYYGKRDTLLTFKNNTIDSFASADFYLYSNDKEFDQFVVNLKKL